MGDGWDYRRRVLDQALSNAGTPPLAYFRDSEDGCAELCIVIDSTHHAIPIKAAHLANMLSDGARLLSKDIQRKR